MSRPRFGIAQRKHSTQPYEDELAWQAKALCREVDPEMFFPNKGEQAVAAEAKRTCRMCEVQPECLVYALNHNENDGIWGGTAERERRELKRRRRAS